MTDASRTEALLALFVDQWPYDELAINGRVYAYECHLCRCLTMSRPEHAVICMATHPEETHRLVAELNKALTSPGGP